MDENRFYLITALKLTELIRAMNTEIQIEHSIVKLGNLDDCWYVVVDRYGIIDESFELEQVLGGNNTIMSA